MTRKLQCTITVQGEDIKTQEDARQALDVMLGCYEDMDDSDTSIVITINEEPESLMF